MKVSIIMSVFNGENFINNAIDSILKQTYTHFEFIITDDGSKDKTGDIIETYAKKDNRIRVLKNKVNIGLTKSLNRAIRCSKGEYIARQDVDDISLPNRLEKQLDFLNNNPDYGFCGTDVCVKQNKESSINFFEIDEIRKNLIIGNQFSHSTILIRRKILENYGLYNEKYRYGQDYELWCRLIYKYKLKAKNLNEKLVLMNIPYERLIKKNSKFVIQQKNYFKTKLKYLKYSKNLISNIRCVISIIRIIFEIFFTFIFNIFKLKFPEQK